MTDNPGADCQILLTCGAMVNYEPPRTTDAASGVSTYNTLQFPLF